MMNKSAAIYVILIIVFQLAQIHAADHGLPEKEQVTTKSILLDLSDRAAGTHDASNIRLFFENYGRISRGAFSYGNAGEFPINSGHNYLWRLCPLVGVAPDTESGRAANVIQSLYADKEWDALGGYHNPAITDIAFSDNPATWPASVWFFQDEEDQPLIVSSQDSYCAYNDATNTVDPLGIQITQLGYAFVLPDIKDMLFFTFEITNYSEVSYDSVYFGFYHDFDIGNDPGGVNDYTDDKLEFDFNNDLIIAYDADNYSSEWGIVPGVMGLAFIETPMINGAMAGVTDMHYGRFYDNDDTQMALLSSNLDYLPEGVSHDDFFFTGSSTDIHFDDLGTIAAGGMDVNGTISSGPFDLTPSDTLTFIIGLIAGTDRDDLYTNLAAAHDLYAKNFVTARPPETPELSAETGDGFVTLYWSDAIESIPDEASGILDFEGYHLFRSLDYGMNWDQIDRNTVPDASAYPVPLASFDRVNGLGDDLGIKYTYRDDTVINGFEYWYSLTAFDQGDSIIARLESPIGSKTASKNIVSIIPRTDASNHSPSNGSDITYTGTGRSNYLLKIDPLSPGLLSTYKYSLSFDYVARSEIGDHGLIAVPIITDSSVTLTKHYGLAFTSANSFDVYDRTTQVNLGSDIPFYLGYEYPFEAGLAVRLDQADASNTPEAGDYLSVNFCATLKRITGQDTLIVVNAQQFDLDLPLVSDDGLLLTFEAQPILQDINIPPILDFDLEFNVVDEDALYNAAYQVSVSGIGTDLDDESFLVIQVLRNSDILIIEADTLMNMESSYFDGIEATVSFDPANPPTVGTSATLTSVLPVTPHIQDAYTFGISENTIEPILANDDLNNIKVVPNPYMTHSAWEHDYGSTRREPIRQLQFINLPSECEIFIFTLSGNLIKTIEHNTSSGTETWDMRAEGGREIVSGIYLYQIRAQGFEYFNRFAVIK